MSSDGAGRQQQGVNEHEAGPGAMDWSAPKTPEELHEWLGAWLDLEVPQEPLIPGHASPMSYLEHAFFEGRGGFGSQEVSSPPDCVVWANRGGGKTFLGAVATLLDLVFKPGIEVRILAGSLDQSKRMHAHLRGLFAMHPFDALVEGKVGERKLRLTNGSGVELLAQSQASVRGTRVQKLRCDEVELFDPEVWEAAQLVTRSKEIDVPGVGPVRVRGAIEALSTMHRPYGLMYELVQEASPDPASSGLRRRLMKWGVVDVLGSCSEARACEGCELEPECGGKAKASGRAPGHISIEDALDLKGRVGSATWEAEMLCLRPTRSGTVLPEFDRRRHVVSDEPAHADAELWIGGMDFGYRGDTVVLWACVRRDSVLVVVDESVASEMVMGAHVATITEARWPKLGWIGVDPAGNQRNDQTGVSNAALLRSAGLTVRDRRMGLAEGIMLLRSRLASGTGKSRLLVHERCGRLIESLERYHYPEDNPRTLAPVKDGADHAVDALRYMVQNLDRPYTSSRSRYV